MKNIDSIIVFRSGLLGDTLVAIPALWCLRKAFPNASIAYLWQRLPNNYFVKGCTVLEGAGLIDKFDYYETCPSMVRRIASAIELFWRLRRHTWDLGIVLEEPHWPARRGHLLKLCGAKLTLGPDGKGVQHPRDDNKRLIRVPHIADTLIDILRPLDIPLPEPGKGCLDVGLGPSEETAVDVWIHAVGATEAPKPWIAIGPWSNMPAKRWPLKRFEKVVSNLIEEFNVTPIVFGGSEERRVGEELILRWGRGYVATGELSIREGIELLGRCAVYLGNDTGTMHMAAAGGTRCVAIFSSRESPGRWEPYGSGHVVFRKNISCEGCMLRECVENKMRCILFIETQEVTDACRQILSQWLRESNGSSLCTSITGLLLNKHHIKRKAQRLMQHA